MAQRKKKTRKRKQKALAEQEGDQLLATITRMISAWKKHSPNKTFAGMSVGQFEKAVQPSFDIRAEIALLEWQIARLEKETSEGDDPASPKSH